MKAEAVRARQKRRKERPPFQRFRKDRGLFLHQAKHDPISGEKTHGRGDHARLRPRTRVSVVSTVGYGAFLAGPPLLGHLGDRIGTLEVLLAVTALMLPAALSVLATRKPA